MVGVHTPEFPFERMASNVEDAIAANGLTYPVVQDNDYGTWNAYGNQYWPAKYLIDFRRQRPLRPLRRGRLRGHRAGDPLAAGRARGSAPRRENAGPRRGAVERDAHPGELSRAWPGPSASPSPRSRVRTATSRRGGWRPTSSPTEVAGRWRRRARPRRGDRRSTSPSAPAESSSSSARRRARAAPGCCSTAGRSVTGSPAETSTAGRSRSMPSASTAWSTCPGSRATGSPCASPPGSPPTPSPSADPCAAERNPRGPMGTERAVRRG